MTGRPTSEVTPGKKFGAYLITRELGRGPLGVSFEATAPDGGRVVLKLLSPESPLSGAARARVADEIEALAQSGSSRVRIVERIAEPEQRLALLSSYLPGRSLADVLAKGPLPREDALAACLDIAEALEDARKAGVVHGGLAPSNVLGTDADAGDGQKWVVADFGAEARTLHWQRPEGARSGEEYAAPEVRAGQRADARSDVYSLGLLLYVMISGGSPAAFEPHVEAFDGVGIRVNKVLARALHADPERRYANAGELAVDLDAPLDPTTDVVSVAAAGLVPVTDDDPPKPGLRAALAGAGGRWQRRRLLIGGLVAVAAIVALVSLLLGRHDTPATPPATAPAAAGTLSAPEVQATAGYRAVVFTAAALPDGATLQVNREHGWHDVSGLQLRVPTVAGDQSACIRARTVVPGADRVSREISACGSSTPAQVRAVRVRPDCTTSGQPQTCYRLVAAGFASHSAPVLQFVVGGATVGTVSVPIGADGRGTLPGGQHFLFADSDAGKTAKITMPGASYSWKVAAR